MLTKLSLSFTLVMISVAVSAVLVKERTTGVLLLNFSSIMKALALKDFS